MEGSVSGIRETFFYDLTEDYLENKKRSFLYREFWRWNMEGLLKTHFPELLEQELPPPEKSGRLKELIGRAMKERPEWQRGGLLLRKSGSKQRRDFWEELWLNSAGCRAGLITDTEYYLWLVQYLSAHDIYYKTNIYYYDKHGDKQTYSGHIWLYKLLQKGLGMKDLEALKREIAARKKTRRKAPNEPRDGEISSKAGAKKTLSKADVEKALAMLAEQIERDRDTVAGRLQVLRDGVRTKDGKKIDYLSWLTARLEWMALHVKIKNWLQDSGYPLRRMTPEKEKTAAEKLEEERLKGEEPEEETLEEERPEEEKKARKSDFTMRLFEAYCDSPEGYVFHKREAYLGNWCLDGMGFCMLDTDKEQLKALLEALEAERGEDPYLYIPLAVHLHSGCVFFLAGKANYEEVYQKEKGANKAAYDRTQARYCFDYLRLTQDHSLGIPGGGAFCLTPAFHLWPAVPGNAGESYEKALKVFKGYCGLIGGKRDEIVNGPLHAIMEYNEEEFDGIPEAFRWAFAT